MLRHLATGAVAGAAGTLALDVATYGDMALRGRPASESSARLVQKLAERAGIASLAAAEPPDAVKNRRSALGTLTGYGVGVGVGTVYGAVRPALRGRVPWWVGALAAGVAAMALADIPLARLGVSDPAAWTAADWASDAIPHLIYGVAVAAIVEAALGEG